MIALATFRIKDAPSLISARRRLMNVSEHLRLGKREEVAITTAMLSYLEEIVSSGRSGELTISLVDDPPKKGYTWTITGTFQRHPAPLQDIFDEVHIRNTKENNHEVMVIEAFKKHTTFLFAEAFSFTSHHEDFIAIFLPRLKTYLVDIGLGSYNAEAVVVSVSESLQAVQDRHEINGMFGLEMSQKPSFFLSLSSIGMENEALLKRVCERVEVHTIGNVPVIDAWISLVRINIITNDFLVKEKNKLEYKTQGEKEMEEKTKALEAAEAVKAKQLYELTRRKAELENEKNAVQKLAAIVEDSNEAILAKSLDGTITEWNKGAEDLYGYTASEIIGKSINTIVPPEKYAEVVDILQKVGRGERIKHYQTVRLKKNGEKINVSVSVGPLKDINDNIVGASVIASDITKEIEIDRMKTEFISLASHQLRTPLSAMKWFLEMLLGGDAGKLTAEQNEFVQNINQSNDRMIELVNSLLNVSRIESGRIIVDPEPTDLGELIKEVQVDLKAKLEEKHQRFTISVHENMPQINVDRKLMRQVYMNLLTNAIKYTPENGEISVLVSKKDNQIISQISDTGYGIPKSEQSRLFQKFYRGTNIIKKVTDGTGLGMYLVKAIIESSEGKIWFESEEGKGSTFWFSLPMSGMIKKEGEISLNA